ncbi:MAG: nuclear transport factor 2 family protein, partial [Cyclobacteriaceae bacterium]|nr:nuclear transport factor 2 family protein [Cyclobacteriaceae bacterium]
MRKEKEQSLNQAYQEFIEIGLNIRPIIDELKHLIDPKIMGFGTTEDERIFSSQEFFDLIKRQEEQATGIKLEHQIKPVHRRVLNGENSAIYVDDMIMRITTDSDQFEIKLRFSIVFEYQEKKWIVVHWHGSKPEEVKSEEDTWGIDIWKKKTEELEQIISEKTADLVEKNRELAIEAALEKVRAVAMGMKKPEDMLAICRIISEQLEKFGVEKIRNIQTAIIDEEKGIYLCYQYFTYYDKEAVERTEYLKNPVEHGMVKQMLASKDGHFTGTISGKELEEFREHRKAENHFPDPLLEDSDEISHCFLSIGQGGLGLTLYQQLDTSILNLFKRFHQVFSLAYRRFQDIQKAEARAREVEIDLALERVRAQTMAMHSSEDVGKCILKMFAELTALGVDERTRFGIGILNHENENNQLWTARKNGDEVNLHVGNINMDWHPMLIKARQAWLQQVPFHKYILEGEDLLDYYRMLNTAPEYKIQIPLETLPKKEIQHCFIFEHGFFYAFCPEEFDSEITSIAQRFSSQFEQTFRRYLDLQQAEAQAREAKIEAALERVRSKSLAMHQTSELQSVIHTVHEELVKLGLSIHGGSFIVINSEIDQELKCWGAGGTAETSQVVQIPRFEKPFYTDLLEGIKRGPGFFTEEFTAEEKNEYFEFLFNHEPWASLSPKEKKQRLEGKKPYFRSCAVSSNTSIFIINHEGVPFSEEDNAILKRFGRVFEQSYTRFLDLQKAEEQAREAQIETALERVRSRTIAMQSSNELSEAATEMFSQIKGLGLNPWSCGFNIFNEDKTVISQWVSSGDGRPIKPFDTPTTEGIFKRIVEDSEKEISLRIEKMEGKKLEDTYTYMASLPILDKIFEELDKAGIELPKSQVDHAAYFKYGYLMFITFDEVPEFHSIFKRFANVFEQTYTRFLDLKKAEAQAREAQIEAALERVRARAMAMHSSKELEEVALELRIQMGKLGQEDLEVCAIHLYEEDEDYFESWGAVRAPGMEEKLFQGMAKFPKSGIKIVDEMMAHYYAGDKDYVLVNDGEKGQEWLLAMKKYSPQAYAMLSKKIESIPTEEIIAYWSISDFKGGALVMVTYTQPDESSLNLLRRAANVFQLAYRRYLDLQKAEEQAREAQIEAALERVRSRTMGMQKAEELGDVATLLFNELNTLVDNLWTCGFVLCEKDRQEDEWWLSADNGLIDPFFLPNVGDYTHESLYEGWKKGESYRTVTLEGPQLQEHYDWLLQIPIAVQIFEEMEGSGIPRPTWQRLHAAYFKTGYLVIITEVPCEEEDIFKRFAQVFDLTYTRFLDLQKAENQAQEAQIEAALEKVRSRSLAMQDPEELTEVAQLLREEMGNLGVEELETSSIYIHEESNGLTQCWFTIKNSQNPARSVSDQMVLDLQDTWVGNQMLRFYRSKEKKTSILMKGEQRVEWIRYC